MNIQRGHLYLADLNPAFGSEAGKVRPVLVIQNDLLNETGHASTLVLPCTTRLIGGNLLRVPLPRGMAGNSQDCEIMIDQGRAIDNRRFLRPLSALPGIILREAEEKFRQLAGL